jgi:hypothetical protein
MAQQSSNLRDQPSVLYASLRTAFPLALAEWSEEEKM